MLPSVFDIYSPLPRSMVVRIRWDSPLVKIAEDDRLSTSFSRLPCNTFRQGEFVSVLTGIHFGYFGAYAPESIFYFSSIPSSIFSIVISVPSSFSSFFPASVTWPPNTAAFPVMPSTRRMAGC